MYTLTIFAAVGCVFGAFLLGETKVWWAMALCIVGAVGFLLYDDEED